MYAKIFAGILHSSIAHNTALRRFFMDMLLLCDKDGNVIMTKEAIAKAMGVTLDEVIWGLDELMKPDAESRNPDHDGRRLLPLEGFGYGWHIVNYAFYRGIKDADQMRAANAERVRRYREKHRNAGAACVTFGNGGNAIAEAEAKAEAEVLIPPPQASPRRKRGRPPQRTFDPEFLAFYEGYPKFRREKRLEAAAAWDKLTDEEKAAVKEKLPAFAEIWNEALEPRRQYCPLPSSWLNGKRWTDNTNATMMQAGLPKTWRPLSAYKPMRRSEDDNAG